MAKVEYALHFQDNLNVLMDSTERIEEANSVQRQESLAVSQEKLARYALLVAMVMVIPGVVSFLNDGSSVFKEMGDSNPLLSAVKVLVGIIVVAGIGKALAWVKHYLFYKKAERENK